MLGKIQATVAEGASKVADRLSGSHTHGGAASTCLGGTTVEKYIAALNGRTFTPEAYGALFAPNVVAHGVRLNGDDLRGVQVRLNSLARAAAAVTHGDTVARSRWSPPPLTPWRPPTLPPCLPRLQALLEHDRILFTTTFPDAAITTESLTCDAGTATVSLRYKFSGTMRGTLPSGVGSPTGKHVSNVCGFAQMKTSACGERGRVWEGGREGEGGRWRERGEGGEGGARERAAAAGHLTHSHRCPSAPTRPADASTGLIEEAYVLMDNYQLLIQCGLIQVRSGAGRRGGECERGGGRCAQRRALRWFSRGAAHRPPRPSSSLRRRASARSSRRSSP
jgi:hypothetical protein